MIATATRKPLGQLLLEKGAIKPEQLERALEEPKPNKPAVGGPICHACDSVSTDNTRKRVQTLFGVYDLQTGHA